METEGITYSKIAREWTKYCYHYESFEKFAKQIYGVTQRRLRELKKEDKQHGKESTTPTLHPKE